MIDKAILLAAQVHEGQVDKSGEPYILHALEVMHRVEPSADGFRRNELLVTAVLHDALEDFRGEPGEEIKLRDYIREWFGGNVLDALTALTRKPNESYEDYIGRIERNWMARRVKIADLSHNMDTGRLPEGDIGEKDFQRWDKYRRALVRLKRGDAE